ncbi:MAG TPA: allantoate amidohydrolase [Candidatus Acidoferrales bacterium]|nr:allantoate amidohydrolase [Candidatus Acidoferrales bacterium]
MSEGRKAQAEKVIARCRKLASFTEEPGRITRTFLSPPMRECHREIGSWVEPLGAEVRIDAAGNFRAFYAGSETNAPKLLIGSHLDTVPDAGAFDGAMGVVLGVSLLEELRGERLPFGIEVVGFSEEEGVRFNTPFIGSRALVGTLDDDILARRDVRGVSVREAIENFGLKPSEIPGARLRGEILGYVEFHIEQGPVLEELGLPLGAVEGLAGQSKMDFTFAGRANHAGTTPMHLRRDAVAGAAEWITAVEREAQRVPGLVATVGAVEAKPGATNVIAGEARASLDMRHRADDVRAAAVEAMVRLAEQIAARRGLTVRHEMKTSHPAVAMDAQLVGEIEEAIRRAGCEPHRMVSGAGHDAMILAEKFPAAMMFVRSPGGISHSPEESVQVEDVAKAIDAGAQLLELLAASPAAQTRRIHRA